MPTVFIKVIVALVSVGLILDPAQSYTLELSPIYEVAASDRVSSSQLYARECTIVASYYDKKPYQGGFPPISIEVSGPGLAKVTYVENTTALSTLSSVNSTTYGRVKISGSSREVISAMDCKGRERNEIGIVELSAQMEAVPRADSLLIEVQLYERQSMLSFRKGGSGDAVILGNVLYKPHNESETKWWKRDGSLVLEIDDGRLFIHDPTAVVEPPVVIIEAINSGSLQAELAVLKAHGEISAHMATFGNPITLFVDEMDPMTLTAASGTFNASSICIASKNGVNMTSRTWVEYPKLTVNSAAYPQGTTCTKLPLPERKPVPLDPSTATSPPTANSAAMSRYSPNGLILALAGGTISLILVAAA